MSIESLAAEINYAVGDDQQRQPVAIALLRDFVRSLHEVFVKSLRDQYDLLAQVQTVLGATPAHHLERVTCAGISSFRSYPSCEDCRLYGLMMKACAERSIPFDEGKALAAHFLKALDEERYCTDGSVDSATFLIYRTLGDEAAYHLGGLFVGDDGDVVHTELQYLDYRLKRFYSWVQRWEMEAAWEKEDLE